MGMALASASVIGREDLAIDELVESARKQLVSWFGESSKSWKNIHNYRIKRAVPSCSVPDRLRNENKWNLPVWGLPGSTIH